MTGQRANEEIVIFDTPTLVMRVQQGGRTFLDGVTDDNNQNMLDTGVGLGQRILPLRGAREDNGGIVHGEQCDLAHAARGIDAVGHQQEQGGPHPGRRSMNRSPISP